MYYNIEQSWENRKKFGNTEKTDQSNMSKGKAIVQLLKALIPGDDQKIFQPYHQDLHGQRNEWQLKLVEVLNKSCENIESYLKQHNEMTEKQLLTRTLVTAKRAVIKCSPLYND